MSSIITENHSNEWSLLKRISFRFICLYFILYIFPFPSSFIPGAWYIIKYYYQLMEAITMVFGEHVFGITETLDSSGNGSGDRLYNYVSMFTNLILALVGCVIWSAVDFKRKSYNRVLEFLSIYLRYYLAMNLLSYGSSKMFTNQFSELSLFDLIKPYGESSPMALMWNFMEYSDGYTIFSGISEVVAGLLLFFRRTRTLGGLVTFGVMLNVFLMNMMYDIPVKIFSGHLMLMGLFIALLDGKRLLNFFLLNKSLEAKTFGYYFKKRWMNISAISFKYLFVVFVIGYFGFNAYSSQSKYGKKAPKPALYGIYDVDYYIRNHDTLAPLKTDSIRWDRLVVDKYSTAVYYTDGTRLFYKKETDTLTNELVLTSGRSSDSARYYHRFKFIKRDSLFYLNGIHQCDTLNIEFSIKKKEDFLLINRGFNWVNDYPYNR